MGKVQDNEKQEESAERQEIWFDKSEIFERSSLSQEKAFRGKED